MRLSHSSKAGTTNLGSPPVPPLNHHSAGLHLHAPLLSVVGPCTTPIPLAPLNGRQNTVGWLSDRTLSSHECQSLQRKARLLYSLLGLFVVKKIPSI